jgi:hypothetical protein
VQPTPEEGLGIGEEAQKAPGGLLPARSMSHFETVRDFTSKRPGGKEKLHSNWTTPVHSARIPRIQSGVKYPVIGSWFGIWAGAWVLCSGLVAWPCCAQCPPTVSLLLGWSASPETNVAGYVVYYGSAVRQYTNSVNAGRQTAAAIHQLSEGVTYHFAVTAYTQRGLESAPSGEIQFTIPRTRVQVCIPTTLVVTDTIQVHFDTLPGRTHLLQASTDLAAWITLATYPASAESMAIDYAEPVPQPLGRRFYRVYLR